MGDVAAKDEELDKQVREFKRVYDETRSQVEQRLELLTVPVAGLDGSPLANYKWYFDKEKTIYNTLNMMKPDKNWFKGLCWCPLNKKDEVDDSIRMLRENKKVVCTNLKEVVDHPLTPPTYFRTNDFLRPFQDIVYTYGVPSYQEADPSLFTVVTFPFLFGIMFGDFAHGLVLLSIAIYVCIRKDHLIKTKSMLAEAVGFRYLLLLMGVFSSFCGFLYNDFAAVPLILGNSCYDTKIGNGPFYNRSDPTCVYPLGIDPKWYAASNELQYINSFKMKISVIVGVSHMVIGIILKGMNAIFYKKPLDFWCEFVPRLIFMLGFFGYMNIMIMIKWTTDWSFVGQNGPSIITLLIGLPLKASDPGDVPLYGDGSNQRFVGNTIMRKLIFATSAGSHLRYLRPLDARYQACLHLL
ncbi:MAG: V-type ATPase 116kDa subunit family protein [Acidobacteriaceae bacterium]|nr:V-type ATPase 116kDa subunit family protein [Acidobacteriaceae bacterium]